MKPIAGFEGKYAIDVDGMIWSAPKPLSGCLEGRGFTKGKWLVGFINNGYKMVNLGAENRNISVHRLVAETYLPRVPGKEHINHKDGNKLNNYCNNLEWCTQAENNQHAWAIGLMRPATKLSKKQVKQIRSERKQGRTQKYLADKYLVGRATIQRAINGSVNAYAF